MTPSFHFLIELRQADIAQQRRLRASLRAARYCWHQNSVFHDSAFGNSLISRITASAAISSRAMFSSRSWLIVP